MDNFEKRHLNESQLAIFDFLDSHKNLHLSLRDVQNYGAYLRGLQCAHAVLFEYLIGLAHKKERPYLDAERRLAESNTRNLFLFYTAKERIGYRNFVKDKKGNLIKCDAYFVEE